MERTEERRGRSYAMESNRANADERKTGAEQDETRMIAILQRSEDAKETIEDDRYRKRSASLRSRTAYVFGQKLSFKRP